MKTYYQDTKPDRPTQAAFSIRFGSLTCGQSFRWPVSSTLDQQWKQNKYKAGRILAGKF